MKRSLIILITLLASLSCVQQEEGSGIDGITVETLEAKNITKSTAVLCGRTHGAYAKMLTRGVCYSTKETVSYEDSKLSFARGEGAFEDTAYELQPNTTYYVRAFAVVAGGEKNFGEVVQFTTSNFNSPVLSELTVSDVLSSEATVKATLLDKGDFPLLERGFVYSKAEDVALEKEGCETIESQGAGSALEACISGLSIGTTYYVKAYVTTEAGVTYSPETSFTTSEDVVPELGATTLLANETMTSIEVSSNLIDPHGTLLAKGFCWASNASPKVTDNVVTLDGDLQYTIEGLKPGSVLYVRSWATNESAGTGYGPALKVVVKTYDCGGNMILVTPAEITYVGWLGDPNQPAYTSFFSEARDSTFSNNLAVNKAATPNPSKASLAPYMIAAYEVTNKDWCDFLNVYGSATIKDGADRGKPLFFAEAQLNRYYYDAETGKYVVPEQYENYAAVGISWYGANEFCTFYGGFLPNEAQWECAARDNVYSNDPATPMYRYSGSNDINEVAVYAANAVLVGGMADVAPVGSKKPNRLGIYDMSGNAQEWTSSWYGNYTASYKDPSSNPQNSKTMRGGRAQRGVLTTFRCCDRDAMVITSYQANKNEYSGFRFCCYPVQ